MDRPVAPPPVPVVPPVPVPPPPPPPVVFPPTPPVEALLEPLALLSLEEVVVDRAACVLRRALAWAEPIALFPDPVVCSTKRLFRELRVRFGSFSYNEGVAIL